MSTERFGLHVCHHDGTEEVRELPEGTLSIGRASENWLCPLDVALSRQHAILRVWHGTVDIEALPTPNGTIVNGERVEGRMELSPGDVVQMGRTVMTIDSLGRDADRRRRQPTVELQDDEDHDLPPMVAESSAMRDLLDRVRRVAHSELPVLITGESGTGKELFAHRIHAWSPRSEGPFVILNCPALAGGLLESELFGVESGVATGVSPRGGRLEQADGGTLFLDEIGDLSIEAQSKLLRFLQNGTIERVGGRSNVRVDVRVVSATNRDLDQAMANESFRKDLYFRIASLRVDVPPLRERPEDVLPIVDWCLESRGHDPSRLGPDARAALCSYPFPGNVRELLAVVERALLLAGGKTVGVGQLDLPRHDERGSERDHIAHARELLDRVTCGEADFWESVHRPYIDHELPRAVIRELVALGLERSGGTVRALADYLGTGHRYRKLLDFVRNNRLIP